MGHRWDCPSRYEAEREGERAQEWGRSRSSNPHESIWGPDEGCPEAADAWRDGYRRAEMREEEQREEAAAEQRACRRQGEADDEAYDALLQEQDYNEPS